MQASLGSWDALTPAQAGELFAGFEAHWWISGGWAIDLCIGHQTRHHEDIDVGIPRSAVSALPEVLAGWDLKVASGGRLTPWLPSTPVPPTVNSLWCRPAPDEPWRLQILLATVRDGWWIYRRDERIRRTLESVVLRDPHDLPYLTPDVQLLFKSKRPRAKDERDLNDLTSRLNSDQIDWLGKALTLVSPGHPWIGRLSERPGSP